MTNRYSKKKVAQFTALQSGALKSRVQLGSPRTLSAFAWPQRVAGWDRCVNTSRSDRGKQKKKKNRCDIFPRITDQLAGHILRIGDAFSALDDVYSFLRSPGEMYQGKVKYCNSDNRDERETYADEGLVGGVECEDLAQTLRLRWRSGGEAVYHHQRPLACVRAQLDKKKKSGFTCTSISTRKSGGPHEFYSCISSRREERHTLVDVLAVLMAFVIIPGDVKDVSRSHQKVLYGKSRVF